MKYLLATAAMIFAIPAGAMAENLLPAKERAGFEIGVGESILGHTVEGSYRLNDSFAVRGMYGKSSYDFEGDIDGNEFDGALDLGGKGLFVDFYPTKGALRMSAGALMLDHSLDASTVGSTEIMGTTYSSTIDAKASFEKDIAPTISVGFNKPLFGSRFMLSGDLGAAYVGGMKVSVKDNSGLIPTADLDAETDDIRDALGDLNVAPFVKVGLSVAF